MAGLSVLLFLASTLLLIVGIISPTLLSKVIRTKLSRKKVAAVFGSLFIVSMFLVGYSSPAAKKGIDEGQRVAVTTTKQTSTPSKGEEPKVEKQQPPKQDKSPREILLAVSKKQLPKSEPVILEEDGGWVIAVINERETDFMMFSGAKQVARDYIFAMYATKLPLKQVSVSSNYYAGGKYYRAGLSGNIAKTQSDSTWTDNSVGPTIFYDFLKSHTNGSAGDGKYSTYIETNLD